MCWFVPIDSMSKRRNYKYTEEQNMDIKKKYIFYEKLNLEYFSYAE